MPLNLAERILDLQDAERARVRGHAPHQRGRRVYALLPRCRACSAPAGAGRSAAGAAVLLRVGQSRLAVEVDRVLGQEEIVVKGLGDVLTGHPLFSGVTVSGDGELILILDVMGLLQKERERARRGASRSRRGARTRRARVLFIDDSLSVRKVAERFLVALGAR